jgi:hypothetical protein
MRKHSRLFSEIAEAAVVWMELFRIGKTRLGSGVLLVAKLTESKSSGHTVRYV